MPLIDLKKFHHDIETASVDEVVDIVMKTREKIWKNCATIAACKTYFSTIRKPYDKKYRNLCPSWPREMSIDEYQFVVADNVKQWLDFNSDVRVVKTLVLLSILRLSPNEQLAFSQQSVKQRKHDLDASTRQHLHVKRFESVSNQLLNSDSYLKRILGLSAMTGRRTAEIAQTAKFERIDDSHVMFSGQLKTRERDDVKPYPIPVLCDVNVAIETLASIRRDKPDLVKLDYSSLHNRISKSLNGIVKKAYAGAVTVGGVETTLSPKSLRAAYAEIAYQYCHDQQGGKVLYFSQILGHGEFDLTTAISYDDFYLIHE